MTIPKRVPLARAILQQRFKPKQAAAIENLIHAMIENELNDHPAVTIKAHTHEPGSGSLSEATEPVPGASAPAEASEAVPEAPEASETSAAIRMLEKSSYREQLRCQGERLLTEFMRLTGGDSHGWDLAQIRRIRREVESFLTYPPEWDGGFRL